MNFESTHSVLQLIVWTGPFRLDEMMTKIMVTEKRDQHCLGRALRPSSCAGPEIACLERTIPRLLKDTGLNPVSSTSMFQVGFLGVLLKLHSRHCTVSDELLPPHLRSVTDVSDDGFWNSSKRPERQDPNSHALFAINVYKRGNITDAFERVFNRFHLTRHLSIH